MSTAVHASRMKDGIEFSDLTEINCLDLNKLPPEDDSTDLWFWMKFIKSDDEEVMDMLATRSPQMRKAVGVLKELPADEATRLRYETREKARRDMESRVDEVDRKWQGVVADKDAEIAGLGAEIADKDAEIERLRAQLANQNS